MHVVHRIVDNINDRTPEAAAICLKWSLHRVHHYLLSLNLFLRWIRYVYFFRPLWNCRSEIIGLLRKNNCWRKTIVSVFFSFSLKKHTTWPASGSSAQYFKTYWIRRLFGQVVWISLQFRKLRILIWASRLTCESLWRALFKGCFTWDYVHERKNQVKKRHPSRETETVMHKIFYPLCKVNSGSAPKDVNCSSRATIRKPM